MRPTISLACILKNEKENLPQLLSSVDNCFDEIHLTDTGSTDGSIELIQKWIEIGQNPAHAKLFLHHFQWVNDFAKARQASFEPVTTDYVMWLDLDDVLSDRKAFIEFRDNLMKIADFWLATYHYGSDAEGTPNCSFARERIVKKHLGFDWKYFVHEGMQPTSHKKKVVDCQYATSWSVIHKRTAEDLKADKSRNLNLFEVNKQNLDARMHYYYGKELFEASKFLEAFTELMQAVTDTNLELHDRIMGIQYACLSAMHLNQFEKAIALAHQGLQLSPTRAEYYVILGDCYLKQGKLKEAVPCFEAASNCGFNKDPLMQGALYNHADSYLHYPLNQLTRIYINLEELGKAEKRLDSALAIGPHTESLGIYKEFQDLKKAIGFINSGHKQKTEDIVITCHPGGPYEWDEEIYKTRGIGGSETAVIEMAHWLSKLTNRRVEVFNNRTISKTFGNVSYYPAAQIQDYFRMKEPKIHIAWRHNVKFTDAPTYIWCHDLCVAGLEKKDNFTAILALSDFHKSYLKSIYGVAENKIWVTRNGLNSDRFKGERLAKTPNKVIWSSSPDRGVDRAMLVMDKVIKEIPDATLHCFYGFDNMLIAGRKDEVKKLEAMVASRPYVKWHGNVTQVELTRHMQESCVWLYPTNFLETYCITAIEALSAHAYPITRRWGGLEDTLGPWAAKGNAIMVPLDCQTESEIEHYALQTTYALKEKLYERMDINPNNFSWESVAREWISKFEL